MSRLIRIGIECESIEGKNPTWGVGRMIMKLLEEISHRPELENKFRFILYFKDQVPDFSFLNSSIFEKKITPVPFFKNRLFPIYYFLLLPVKLWFEDLDWMFWPNYMLPIVDMNKSMVMLTEDVCYEANEGDLPFRYRLAYLIFGWWTAKFADKIMAISETSKKNISKLYDISTSRIFVDYLGVDQLSTGDQQPATSDYILYAGQAFPRRHLKETLLAFEKITKDFPDLKLIAVGPDKYPEPTVQPLVSEINARLGREAIVHKDRVEDAELVRLYKGAKTLVYVSEREAFGLPPMEALTFGIPPIIADNELGHELFGDHAFYVKNQGTEGIAEGMREALTNSEKIEKIKNSGPEFVKKYNWKSFTDKFLENLEK